MTPPRARSLPLPACPRQRRAELVPRRRHTPPWPALAGVVVVPLSSEQRPRLPLMEPRLFPAVAALHQGLPSPPPRRFAPSAGAPPGTALDGAGVVCPSAGLAVAHATLVCESPPHRHRVCPPFSWTCAEFSHPASVHRLLFCAGTLDSAEILKNSMCTAVAFEITVPLTSGPTCHTHVKKRRERWRWPSPSPSALAASAGRQLDEERLWRFVEEEDARRGGAAAAGRQLGEEERRRRFGEEEERGKEERRFGEEEDARWEGAAVRRSAARW
uniref:Uncharacterized protein n=1 Tax=Oryza meridionalis TaxID=40149 RepID=A0A0E0DNT5_9ORYZ